MGVNWRETRRGQLGDLYSIPGDRSGKLDCLVADQWEDKGSRDFPIPPCIEASRRDKESSFVSQVATRAPKCQPRASADSESQRPNFSLSFPVTICCVACF